MTGEEMGPVGPKLVRLLYFVGAGFICTAAINKWRDVQRKSVQLPEKPSNAVEVIPRPLVSPRGSPPKLDFGHGWGKA